MFILGEKIKWNNIKNDIHFFRTMHSITELTSEQIFTYRLCFIFKNFKDLNMITKTSYRKVIKIFKFI
jgi:hypothetical protein